MTTVMGLTSVHARMDSLETCAKNVSIEALMCNIYHTHVLIYSIERSVPAISFNDFKHTYNEQKQLKLTKS